ncbi:MAG: YjbQ family protein [Planctomycetes bacterium]|nr:YjbQ family protein [Planctomycetota bacterium]
MQEFKVYTSSRSQLIDITHEVSCILSGYKAQDGIITVFTPHTTAAITINENADPAVCSDILSKLDRLIPPGEAFYRHLEGNSDSHLKSSLVGASEQILVKGGKLVLGTWQGIYFAEFDGPRTRKVYVDFIEK